MLGCGRDVSRCVRLCFEGVNVAKLGRMMADYDMVGRDF